MKLNKLFMGIFGVLALTACSTDEIVPEQKPIVGEGETKYMSVTIRPANSGTTRDGENAQLPFEIGGKKENEVNSLRFYFFDGEDKSIAVNTDGRSYFDCPKDSIKADDKTLPDGVEKVLNAVIVINSNDAKIGEKIKSMVAIANFDTSSIPGLNTVTKLTDLQSIIFTETAHEAHRTKTDGGFLMTNSSLVLDGNPIFATPITADKVRPARNEALNNPVDVYVERAVAKVRVRTLWTEGFKNVVGEPIELELEGAKWPAIPLYSQATETTAAQPIKVKIEKAVEGSENKVESEEQVYVIFKGWNIWWTATNGYLIKNIDNWTNLGGSWWNGDTYMRSYWAQNPTEELGFALTKYRHEEANKTVFTGEASANIPEDENHIAYCLENAANAEGGLKEKYDPNKETTNRTLVYLGGILVTNNSGKAEPIYLAEWASLRGTESAIKATMFKNIQNKYYYRTANPISSDGTSTTLPDGTTIITGSESYGYIPVTVGDLKFLPALQASGLIDKELANTDAENSARYRSYLTLCDSEGEATLPTKKGEFELENQLYKVNEDGTTYSKVDLKDVNIELINLGGAKVWENGTTYYYKEIEHLNTADNEGTKGRYGVVRNHIYEIQLNSVFGLGTPVLNPIGGTDNNDWLEIIPQKPSHEFYLGARVNILAWRLVNNSTSLDW